MKPTVTVKVEDKKWREFLRATRTMLKDTGAHVKVGVLDDGRAGSEKRGALSNAQIASIHEFGSSDGRIPER